MVARADDIPGVVSSSGILPSATPTTREEINRRRAIAAALASRQRPFPKTIGEGLTSLGEAFGDVMAEKRLGAQEAELQRRVGAELSPTAGAVPAVAAPPPVSIVPPRVAPAPTAPIAPAARVTAPPAAIDPRDALTRAAMAREGIVGPSMQQPAREVASPDPTQAGEVPPPISSNAMATETPSIPDGGDDPIWVARQSAIGGIESSGAKDPYRAIGAPTKYGRGIGRYQVVEANIAPWTQAALGQALTPQQYLASPQAQDAVFKHRFGQYVDQFGEEGAARAWFGGPGNVGKTDLTDLHKRLSIGDYGKTYMEGLKASADPARLAYAPTGTATDAPPVGARGGMAIPPLAEENPVTPSDITPAPTRVAEARGVVPGAAPILPPSRSAAPVDYDMPEPKPPKEPQRIPETDLQQRARRALAIDPEHRGAAAIWAQGEAQRKFDEQREIERYRSEMTHYNTLHTKWQDIQVNRKKRGLEEKKLEQEVETGKTQKLGTNDRLVKWDERSGSFKDVTPDPKGAKEGEAPVIELNAEQSKDLGFHSKASLAMQQYSRIPDADKILAEGLQEELAGRLPFFGNAALSKRYRIARQAAESFIQAHLRDISGAAIGAKEMMTTYSNLVPIYGDDPTTQRNKAAQRDAVIQGLYLGLGKARPLADFTLKKRAETDAAEQAKIDREMAGVPKEVGKIYKDGSKRRYWTGSRWEDD